MDTLNESEEGATALIDALVGLLLQETSVLFGKLFSEELPQTRRVQSNISPSAAIVKVDRRINVQMQP